MDRRQQPREVQGAVGDFVMRGPYACLLPLAPSSPASTIDLPGGGLGERSMPLLCPSAALPEPVLAHRLEWSCESLPSVSERLHHMLNHRRLANTALAVGIVSPNDSIADALAAEGLAETAALAVPLYAVTASDRSRVRDVC